MIGIIYDMKEIVIQTKKKLNLNNENTYYFCFFGMCFHVCVTPPVEVSPKEARHTSMQTRAFWNGVIISLSRKRLYTQFWLTGGVMQRDCRRHIKWPSKVQEFAEELREERLKKFQNVWRSFDMSAESEECNCPVLPVTAPCYP